MAGPDSKWMPLMTVVIGVAAVGFLGALFYENRASERRLAELQAELKGDGVARAAAERRAKSTGAVPPGSTSAPPGSTQRTGPVAMRPEAQLLIETLNLDEGQWATLLRTNGQWLTQLRAAQANPAQAATLAQAQSIRFLTLNGVFQKTPGGLKKYQEFEATLTATRVVVAGANGEKYEGVEFQ